MFESEPKLNFYSWIYFQLKSGNAEIDSLIYYTVKLMGKIEKRVFHHRERDSLAFRMQFSARRYDVSTGKDPRAANLMGTEHILINIEYAFLREV